jgi:hypothetical protein
METKIMTPQTHPDHETIGQRFKAWDGHTYLCDSYDPRIGFWMTREDAPPERRQDEHSDWRKNVSERAIGRTFHRIWD